MNNSTAIILILFLCISVGFNFLLLERMTDDLYSSEELPPIDHWGTMFQEVGTDQPSEKFAWLPLLVIAIVGILIPVLVCPAYHDWRWN